MGERRRRAAVFAISSGIGLIGVSCRALGQIPFSIIRASAHSRYAS